MKTDAEILKRWEAVVDYSSKSIPPISEEERMPMAKACEEWESKYIEMNEKGVALNANFLKYSIPQLRRSRNTLKVLGDVLIDGKKCMLLEHGELYQYKGIMAIPYHIESYSAHYSDVYVQEEKDVWEFLFNDGND